MRKRGTTKSYVYTVPARKAIAAVRAKVSAATYRSTLHQDLDELLTRLTRSCAAGRIYFRHGVSKAVFGSRDSHAWRRIGSWIRRKHARISWSQIRRRFCDQGWRFAHNGVVFTGASSVAVIRYRYRGNRIPTPWTPTLAPATSG